MAREFIENHLLKLESLKLIGADVPLGVPANKAYYAELSSRPAHSPPRWTTRAAGVPIPNIAEMGRFFPAIDAALRGHHQRTAERRKTRSMARRRG